MAHVGTLDVHAEERGAIDQGGGGAPWRWFWWSAVSGCGGNTLGLGGGGGRGILRDSIHRIWVLIMCDLGIGSEPCFTVYFLIRLRF